VVIHELELNDLRPRSLDRWLSISHEEVWPSLERIGVRVVGAWLVALGRSPQTVVLYEYPDHGAIAQRCGLFAPENQSPAFVERAELLEHSTSELLIPSPHWPVSLGQRSGIFTIRRFHVNPASIGRFQKMTGELIWPKGREHGYGDYVGLWTTALSARPRIVMMTRYDSFGLWDETHPAHGASISDGDLVEWRAALAERDLETLSSEVIVLRSLPVPAIRSEGDSAVQLSSSPLKTARASSNRDETPVRE